MALATGRVVQKRRRGGSQLPEQWLKLLRSIQILNGTGEFSIR
jgi:hypothetical protein